MNFRNPLEMFGSMFAYLGAKHDHYVDFGWPTDVTFSQTYRMYCRNSLAAAGVDKTVGKTWSDMPTLWEKEEPAESTLEADIRKHFSAIRAWQSLAETDKRSMVGRYAGAILRFRDDKSLSEPVDGGMTGIADLVEIIPAWENQLKVTEFWTDPNDDRYGKPKMFEFSETGMDDQNKLARNVPIHPDRVLVWSDDGTVSCRSALEPGYNDLLDAEKVKGAGGEGFWKTSRGAMTLQAEEGQTPAKVAKAMGVGEADVLDKINKQVDDFQKGFDKMLLLGGMKPVALDISLPDPENFFAAPVNCFAASLQIPVKILLGSQTGERASTEDAKEWAATCNSRRANRCVPLISELVNRLVRFGLLPEADWTIGWADLTEASAGEKLERAKGMSEINHQTVPGDDPAFTPDEIREAAGYKAMGLDREGSDE